MKKENNETLVKVPLSKLLKRFANVDVISEIERESKASSPKYINPSLIDDSIFLRNAKLDEKKLLEVFSFKYEKQIYKPIFIRRKKDHFEVVIGRRRLLIAKLEKIESIPCVLLDIDDETALLMIAADIRDSVTRNVVELSLVCNKLANDFHYSQADLAALLHQSRSQITNVMRLTNLPIRVLDDVSTGKLSFGHAKALLVLPEEKILSLIDEIYEKNLSVREIEKVIYEYKHELDYSSDERSIDSLFNCKSDIVRNRVTLDFETEEEKENLIQYLKEYKK